MRQSLNGLGLLTLAFVLSACAGNFAPKSPTTNQNAAEGTQPGSDPGVLPGVDTPSIDPNVDLTSIEVHQQRYPLKDTHTKLVDNHGNGFDALYGVRNFRSVLSGVAYRGGANNMYNKYGKRDNRNPLPTLGLNNLCKEGFSSAVYLYATNFSTAPKSVNCQTFSGSVNRLPYATLNPTSDAGINAIFDRVLNAINNPNAGPVYLHCWNGWHASGLASALILRQFCGMSADAAVAYWDLNTDGAPVDSSYTGIRNRIRTFVPRAQYQISAAIRREICPN